MSIKIFSFEILGVRDLLVFFGRGLYPSLKSLGEGGKRPPPHELAVSSVNQLDGKGGVRRKQSP